MLTSKISTKRGSHLFLFLLKSLLVPGGGFEPPQARSSPAPQAGASTYSAIPAKSQYNSKFKTYFPLRVNILKSNIFTHSFVSFKRYSLILSFEL